LSRNDPVETILDRVGACDGQASELMRLDGIAEPLRMIAPNKSAVAKTSS